MSETLALQPARESALEDRSEWLGGSDISAAVGISPWKSPYDLWLEKTGKAEESQRTVAEHERLYFGKLMEPVILQALEDRHGFSIRFRNERYISSRYDWARAEIDAEGHTDTMRACNVECKNVNAFARKGWGEAGTDDAPDYYVAQAIWGQWCSGQNFTVAAAFFGGSSLQLFPIEHDNDVLDWLVTEGERFWTRHVLADVPPPPRTKEDAARVIAKLPGFRWVPNEMQRINLTALRHAKKAKKEIELGIADIEERITVAFAAAEKVHPDVDGKYSMVDEAGNIMASWNRQTRKAYSVPETSFHVLRIAGEK